jgi:hypothetical protein
MRKVEFITLDSGLLGRALWVLNNVWVISIFILVCLFIPAMTYLGFLLYSSDLFLVWDRVSPLVVLVLWVGIGLALALGASLVGLFFLPIANKGTNLFRINCAMRSRLRGSEKWGPVTRATLLALGVALCTLVVALFTIVRWNEGFEPGFPALTAGVIGFAVLVVGFCRLCGSGSIVVGRASKKRIVSSFSSFDHSGETRSIQEAGRLAR